MTHQDKEKIISRIINLEHEITLSVIQGHKPSIDDKFQEKRVELNTLRCLLFGYGSEYCKKIQF